MHIWTIDYDTTPPTLISMEWAELVEAFTPEMEGVPFSDRETVAEENKYFPSVYETYAEAVEALAEELSERESPRDDAAEARVLKCWALDDFFYDEDAETEEDLRTDAILAVVYDDDSQVPEALMQNVTSDYGHMTPRDLREAVWDRWLCYENVYNLGKRGITW